MRIDTVYIENDHEIIDPNKSERLRTSTKEPGDMTVLLLVYNGLLISHQ